jgi:hypothetical protein
METCKLKLNPHEIPFLVTRWLYNFQPTEDSVALNPDAIQRIRNAAGELATAFADLGVFGTRNMVRLKDPFYFIHDIVTVLTCESHDSRNWKLVEPLNYLTPVHLTKTS